MSNQIITLYYYIVSLYIISLYYIIIDGMMSFYHTSVLYNSMTSVHYIIIS